MTKTGVAFVCLNFVVTNKMSLFLPFKLLMFLAAVTCRVKGAFYKESRRNR